MGKIVAKMNFSLSHSISCRLHPKLAYIFTIAACNFGGFSEWRSTNQEDPEDQFIKFVKIWPWEDSSISSSSWLEDDITAARW